MKLVLYDGSKVIQIVEEVINPVVEDNKVSWDGGSLNGISYPFVLLDDTVEVIEMSAEKEALDQKGQFKKKDLIKENAELKKQITDLSFELMMKGVL